MKRKLISALLVSVMTISLAACGTGGGSSEGGEGGSGSSEGGHKLTVYAWDPAFNIPAIEAAAADYKENVDSEFELEILEQADCKIDGFCSGIGTGGTITGIGEVLKEKNPDIEIWAVEPEHAAILSGGSIGTHIQMGIGDGLIPAILNTQISS